MQPYPGHLRPQQDQSVEGPGLGRQIVALVVFLAASFLVAGLGALATAGNVDGWYRTADKAP